MEIKLARNIKNKREERQMMQEDLAKALGVATSTISSWECGRTEPNMVMFSKMCDIFKCTEEELLYGAKAPAVDYVASLSNEERYLIEIYRESDNAARYAALQQLMNHLAQKGKK